MPWSCKWFSPSGFATKIVFLFIYLGCLYQKLLSQRECSEEPLTLGMHVIFLSHSVVQARVFWWEFFVLFCFCFQQSSAPGHHYTVVLHKQIPHCAISILSFRQCFYEVIIIRIKCNFLSVTDNSTHVFE